MEKDASSAAPVETRLTWDRLAVQAPLTVSNENLTLSWDKPGSSQYQPVFLRALSTGELKGSHFYWEFVIESSRQQQLGVGVILEPACWVHPGYLGAGGNSWSYDPLRGVIATRQQALHSGLPTFPDSGVIAVELDLAESDTFTFIVNGERTLPIELPLGCTVMPAACLFAVGQKVTLRNFVANKPEVLSLAKARRKRERARVPEEAASQKRPSGAALRLADTILKIVEFAECESALLRDPGNIRLRYKQIKLLKTRAVIPDDEVRRNKVLAAYETLCMLAPEDDKAWMGRADWLHLHGRGEDALACLDKCKQRNANYWLARAHYLDTLGRFEEALSCLRTVQQMQPEDNFLLGNIGGSLAKLKRWEEALEVLEQALRTNPHYVAARLEKGQCLIGLQRYEEALAVIHEVDITRKMGKTKSLLAYVFFKLGHPDMARRLLDAELSWAPKTQPLDENGRTVLGTEVEEEFQTLAREVYDRYEPLRRDD
ncbi:MAG TPA: tetratricopeptide repeat protein [Archangium sp.]|uniref:tetratricopeptide repeat protein n=1 Tax=Archangium sp. TaxID=1872627 RepID=UPI002E30F08D|nr:tetratricopeptide repeat protein [Archangium sp.]HEX5747998.1 tetratricopeptide repeat protein [Archangium sp.]